MKTENFIFAIAAAALAFVGCRKELFVEPEQDVYSIVFVKETDEPVTKAGISEKDLSLMGGGGSLIATLLKNGEQLSESVQNTSVGWTWSREADRISGEGEIYLIDSGTEDDRRVALSTSSVGERKINVEAYYDGAKRASASLTIKVNPDYFIGDIPDLYQKGYDYYESNKTTTPLKHNGTYDFNSTFSPKVYKYLSKEGDREEVTSQCTNWYAVEGRVNVANGKITAKENVKGIERISCKYNGATITSNEFNVLERKATFTISKTSYSEQEGNVMVNYDVDGFAGIDVVGPGWMHALGGPFSSGKNSFLISIDNNSGAERSGYLAFFPGDNSSGNPATGEALYRVTVHQDEYNSAPVSTITLSEVELDLDGAQGSNASVTISGLAEHQPWSAEVAQSSGWITVNPMSGTGNQSVNISVSKNSTGALREGHVTFKAGTGNSVTLYVRQSAYLPPLKVSASAATYPGAGPTQGNTVVTFTITNTRNFAITVSDVTYLGQYYVYGQSTPGTMNLGTSMDKTSYEANETLTVTRGHGQVNGGQLTFSYRYDGQTYTETVYW